MLVITTDTSIGNHNHSTVELACIGFKMKGYEILKVQYDEFIAGKHDDLLKRDDVIVFGSVGLVLNALDKMGIKRPEPLDFPYELFPYFGRNIRIGKFKEVLNENLWPLQVKPIKHKLFKGTVIKKFVDLIPIFWVDDNTDVYIQQYVNMLSEWRATVLHGEIINVAHYMGNPLIFPHRLRMEEVVRSYKTQPSAYGIDFAVTDRLLVNPTIVIEVNDAFALGNYGLRPLEYVNVIETRWKELTKG